MAVNVFGGGPVQPAIVQYRAINLSDNLTLNWATSYLDTGDVVAANMNVLTASSTSFVITLPDATQVGVGMQFVFSNIGSSNFTINTNRGTLVRTALIGTSYYIYLTDNSTSEGTWSSLVYGGTTSSASAADLAGYGLVALPNPPQISTLNTAMKPVLTSNVSFAPDATNRSNLIVWTGGADEMRLPTLSSSEEDKGFFISFNNQGSGDLTLIPAGSSLIDGESEVVIDQEQSLIAIWDGTNWYSLGFGQDLFFQFNILNKAISGNTNVTLTAPEANNQVQQYTSTAGPLTGNVTITFPAAVRFEWIIYNNTTGAFTLGVQVAGQVTPPTLVPQGSSMLFYSDGTQMRPVPTSAISTVIQMAPGTVIAPGLSFTNSTSTGLYSPSVGQVSLTASAVEALRATSSDITLKHPTAVTGNVTVTGNIAVTGSISVTDRQTTLDNIAPATPGRGSVLSYDGSEWIAGGFPILDIKKGFSDTAGSALTNTTFADLAGMTVTTTNSAPAGIFLIMAQLNISSDQVGMLRITRNGTPIGIGTGGGNTTKFAASPTYLPYTLIHIDSAPTGAPLVYTIQAATTGGNYYLNRDTASSADPGYSSIQVIQIGGGY